MSGNLFIRIVRMNVLQSIVKRYKNGLNQGHMNVPDSG